MASACEERVVQHGCPKVDAYPGTIHMYTYSVCPCKHFYNRRCSCTSGCSDGNGKHERHESIFSSYT